MTLWRLALNHMVGSRFGTESCSVARLKRGCCGTLTHDYKRHGTITLFAVLSLLDGRMIGDGMPQHRHQEFIRYLKQIDSTTPAGLRPVGGNTRSPFPHPSVAIHPIGVQSFQPWVHCGRVLTGLAIDLVRFMGASLRSRPPWPPRISPSGSNWSSTILFGLRSFQMPMRWLSFRQPRSCFGTAPVLAGRARAGRPRHEPNTNFILQYFSSTLAASLSLLRGCIEQSDPALFLP
jgi:hypothetical protein